MSRIIEQSSGAVILPEPDRNPRQKATTWSVVCCIDADHRTKYPVYYDIAKGMTVERSDRAD